MGLINGLLSLAFVSTPTIYVFQSIQPKNDEINAYTAEVYKNSDSAENVQKSKKILFSNLLSEYNVNWNETSVLMDDFGNDVDVNGGFETSNDSISKKIKYFYSDNRSQIEFDLYDNRVKKDFKFSEGKDSKSYQWGNKTFDMTSALQRWINSFRSSEIPKSLVEKNTYGNIQAKLHSGKTYGSQSYKDNDNLKKFIDKIIENKTDLTSIKASGKYKAFKGDHVKVYLTNSFGETYTVVDHYFNILTTGVGASYDFWTNSFSYLAVV